MRLAGKITVVTGACGGIGRAIVARAIDEGASVMAADLDADALELAPHGIRVVAVAPGRVDTPLLRQYEALGLWDHIRREQMRETFTQPSEIAAVMVFLASDDANCINGVTVAADDGFTSFKYPLLSGSAVGAQERA